MLEQNSKKTDTVQSLRSQALWWAFLVSIAPYGGISNYAQVAGTLSKMLLSCAAHWDILVAANQGNSLKIRQSSI